MNNLNLKFDHRHYSACPMQTLMDMLDRADGVIVALKALYASGGDIPENAMFYALSAASMELKDAQGLVDALMAASRAKPSANAAS